MNGPEHYAEAELCLDKARVNAEIGDRDEAALWAAQASAHAQLAMVAAHINTKAAPEFPLAHAPHLHDEPASPTWKDVIQ